MRPYNFLNSRGNEKYIFLPKRVISLILMICICEFVVVVTQPESVFFKRVWAKTEAVPDVLKGFKCWYGKVTSLKADFHQKTLHPLWGEEQEAIGKVWFKKPGLMRWKYLSPQQDIIIINEQGFFWYVPEDNQVIKKEKKEAFRVISPMSILGENMQLEKDFEIIGIEEIYRGGEKNEDKKERDLFGYAILLKPRDTEAAFKKISIEVKAKRFSLAAIEVEETSGNLNRIDFERFEINQEMSPDLFQFTPSPGTKVITPEDFPTF
jgi:outer membrane lipoprotein carrier protein